MYGKSWLDGCGVSRVSWFHRCFADLMAKVNAAPKKKTPVKTNTSGHLPAPPADPSVNAPRKFSGFTGKLRHPK